MSVSTAPNLGLHSGWNTGDDNWGDPMNDNLDLIDVVAHLHVLSATTSVPPLAPLEGDRYIVPDNGTGMWATLHGQVVVSRSGFWRAYKPKEGWVARVRDADNSQVVFDGLTWGVRSLSNEFARDYQDIVDKDLLTQEGLEKLGDDVQQQAEKLLQEAEQRAQGMQQLADRLNQEALDRAAALAAEAQARADAIRAEELKRLQGDADASAALAQGLADEASVRAQGLQDEATRRAQDIAGLAAGLEWQSNELNDRIDAVSAKVSDILGTEEYDPEKEYPAGSMVKRNGKLYRAEQAVPINTPPPNPAYWELLGEYASLGDLVAAQALQISDLTTRVTANAQGITAEATARNTLAAQIRGSYTGNDPAMLTQGLIFNERQARVSADQAFASELNSVSARLGAAEGQIGGQATAITDLTASVSRIDGVAQSNAQQLVTLTASLDGLEENTSTAISGLDARVTANAQGLVAQSSDITTLKNRVGDVEAGAGAMSTAISGLTSRVEDTEAGLLSQSDQITSLGNRLTSAEGLGGANSTAIASLQSRVSDQGGVLDSHASQLVSLSNDLAVLDSALADKASSSALQALDSRVTTAEGTITSQATALTNLQNRLETAEGGLAASSGALNSLDSRVTAAEGKLTSQATSITSLNASVGTKNRTYRQATAPTTGLVVGDLWINTTAGQNNRQSRWNGTGWDDVTDPRIATAATASAVQALDVRVTAAEGVNTSQASSITKLQNDLTQLSGVVDTKATSEALSSLQSTVTQQGNTITSQGVSLTTLNNKVNHATTGLDAKASSAALSALDSKVTVQGNTITSQGTAITNLQNDLDVVKGDVATKASAAALTALTNRVTAAEGSITSQSTSITSLQNSVTGLQSGKAEASALASLQSTVTQQGSTLTSQSGQITSLQNSLTSAGGQNLLYNPSFDIGAATGIAGMADGYSRSYPNGVVATPSLPASWLDPRGKAQRYDCTGLSASLYADLHSTNNFKVSAVEGQRLALSVFVRAAAGLQVRVYMQARANQTTTATLTTYTSTSVAPGEAGTRISLVSTALPAGTTAVHVIFRFYGTASVSAGWVEWDRAQIELGDVVTGWRDNSGAVTNTQASAIQALDSRVTSAEGTITSQASTLTALKSTIENPTSGLGSKASASSVQSIETRVTSAEGTLSAQVTALSQLQASVGDQSTKITSLQTLTQAQAQTLTSLSATVDTHGSDITSLKTATADMAESLDSLETTSGFQSSKIATLEQTTASQGTRLTSVETQSSSNQSRITTVENTTASQGTRLTAVETKSAEAISRVATVETTTANQAGRLTTVETNVGNQGSRISTLETTTSNQASSITKLQSSLSGAGGQNLFYNPSFEVADGATGFADGWEASGNAGSARTPSLVSSWIEPSGKAQRLDCTGLSTSVYVDLRAQVSRRPSVVEGQRVALSAYVRGTAGLNVRMFLQAISASGASLITYNGVYADLSAAGTRTELVSPALPAGTVAIVALLRVHGASVPAGYVEWDRVQLEFGDTVTGWRDNGLAPVAAANAAITNEATTRANADSALATRTTALETRMPTGTGQLATAAAMTALETRVTAAEGVNTSQSTNITNLQNSVTSLQSGKADASALSALDSKVTTQGNTLTTQGSAITALQNSITNGPVLPSDFSAGLGNWTLGRQGDPSVVASAAGTIVSDDADFGVCAQFNNWTVAGQNVLTKGLVQAIPGRVYRVRARFKVAAAGGFPLGLNLVAGGNTATYSSGGDAFSSPISITAAGQIAEITALFSDKAANASGAIAWGATAVFLRFGLRINGNIATGLQLRVQSITVEDATADAANADATTALTSRVTTAEGNITSTSGALTTLTNRVTAAEGVNTSQATAISGLNSSVSTINGTLTSQGSSITSLQASLSDAGGANLIYNPGFELYSGNTVKGWTHGAGGTGALAGEAVALSVVDSTLPGSKKAARREAVNLSSTRYIDLVILNANRPKAQIGKKVALSYMMRGTPGLRTQTWLQFINASGSSIASASITADLSDEWSKMTLISGAAPAEAVLVAVWVGRVFGPAGGGSAWVEVDNVQLEIGDTVTGWRDNVDAQIDAQADATTALTNRVTTAEGNITSTSSALTTLTNRVTAAEGVNTSQATAISGLNSSVSTINGTLTSQASQITNLQSSLSDGSGAGFAATASWDFASGTDGWTASGATLVASNGIATFTATASDPQLTRSRLSILGRDNPIIRMRVRRKSAGSNWDGKVYFSTSGHGYSGSYMQAFPVSLIGDSWGVVEIDMSSLSQGGSDWINSVIAAVRIDFYSDAAGAYEFDWISIGSRMAAASNSALQSEVSTRATADTAITNSVTALTARVGQAEADIVTERNARTDGHTALSTQLNTVQATANTANAKATDATTALATLGNQVKATRNIAVEAVAGGRYAYAGINIGVEGDQTSLQSTVLVQANKFSVVNGAGADAPFQVSGGVTTIRNALIKELGADNISARAIKASHMVVTGAGAALNPDPAMTDAGWWNYSNLATRSIINVTDGYSGSTVLQTTANVQDEYGAADQRFPIDPTKNYLLEFVVRRLSGTGTLYGVSKFYNSAGAAITVPTGLGWPGTNGARGYFPNNYTPATGAWNRLTISIGPNGTAKFPAGAVSMSLGYLAGYTAGGTWQFAAIRLTEMVGADLQVEGSIEARHLKAGSVTADKLTVGRGGNLCPDSTFTPGLNFWRKDVYPADMQPTVYGVNMNAEWAVSGSPTAFCEDTSKKYIGNAAAYKDLVSSPISVIPGERYEASVYCGWHRCRGEVILSFYDANGNFFASNSIASVADGSTGLTGGKSLAGYYFAAGFVTVPAGAVAMRLHLRAGSTSPGQGNCYAFYTRPFVGRANPNQTEFTPWSPSTNTNILPDGITTPSISALAGNFGEIDIRPQAGATGVIRVWDGNGVMRVRLGIW